MILRCAVLFLCLGYTMGFEIGDACVAKGQFPGTCKPLNKCLFAYRQIENYVKVTDCGWKGRTRVVCCQIGGQLADLGALRKYLGGARKGKVEGPDMTCLYSGEMPALCCANTKDQPPQPEPSGCPALPPPPVATTDIAFAKCLEYRRYVEPCVGGGTPSDPYRRELACEMDSTGNRITAGEPAWPNEFPHMALLGCRNEVDPAIAPIQWVAGGALISDKYILTAGHVLSHKDYGRLRYALLGASNKTKPLDGKLYTIVDIIAHKLYETNQKPHDIALLKLDRRVDFDEFIRPACLPSPGLELEHATDRILAGWGQTETSKASEVLMKAYISELDYETECSKRWEDKTKKIFKKDSMLCAGVNSTTTKQNKNPDSCQGDSGGPLMAVAASYLPCTYVVRGVVSFGPSCGSGPPGIYTNVQNYLPWIIDKVWPKN